MKKIIVTLIISGMAAISSAAIINIPADYPTIQQGIDASSDGDTVLVQPGTYVENINFNGHNIVLGSLFLTTGDTSYISQTVIDGGNSDRVVLIEDGEYPSSIIGFTIQNGNLFSGVGPGVLCVESNTVISFNIIRDNSTGGISGHGGAIYAWGHSIISNNIIYNNSVNNPQANGGGVFCFTSINSNDSIFVLNNIIVSNYASDGAIFCSGPNIYLIGNTIYRNTGFDCGGIYFFQDSSSILINNIIYENYPLTEPQIMLYASLPMIAFCDIYGGWPGTGNIDVDPLLRNPINRDFHLMSTACGDLYDSPCIDAGSPNIIDSLLDCSWGLGGPRSDMGAYGGGDSAIVRIFENIPFLPVEHLNIRNYPNPFNGSTTIEFDLPISCYTTIDIFDILGRRIENLLSEIKPPGSHSIKWQAIDRASGLYFYKLEACDYTRIRPMVLIK